jgi:peptidoglycan/xylan/chitin deacetylase (PgdA/CDA1 family)
MPRSSPPVDRRLFFGLLAVGLATTVAGCRDGAAGTPPNGEPTTGASTAPSGPPGWDESPPTTPSGPPGPNRVLSRGPAGNNRIALTVDDGYSNEVVAGYVDFAVRTGIHLTFSPNGVYNHSWAPHAEALRPLLERGQVQLINHTYSHHDLRRMTDAQIRAELERNEEWATKTFGISTKPYYRPPFGFHNQHIDGLAGDLGYRNTVMWSGSYSDSKLVTPQFLMSQANRYLQPGVIMLGHANHPTVLGLFDQLTQLIKARNLDPVTLNEMFGSVAPSA